MKMNNKMKAVVKIVEGLIFIAIGLSMVGCEEAKEVENIAIQDTKPVVEYCEYCGHEEENGECGACEGYEAAAHLFDDGLNDVTRAIYTEHYKNCKFEHTPIDAPQVVKEESKEIAHDEDIEPCVICEEFGFKKDMIRMGDGYYDEFCYNEITKVEEEVEKAVCYTCGVEVDEATAHYNGRSYRCEGCYWAEQGLETPNAEATKCDACGTTNIEVMDSAGGYICNECGHCN